jgi:thiosulfate reductase cytochrome b subunit
VIRLDGEAQSDCRGVEPGHDPNLSPATTLISAYQPVLLPEVQPDGRYALAPYNLISAWFWVYGEPERPVAEQDLRAAWLDGEAYREDVLALLDVNRDGSLDSAELALATPQAESLIRENLAALGLDNPRIVGRVQPYSINHGVVTGRWATATCESCHGENSLITQPLLLSSYLPGDVMPTWLGRENAQLNGQILVNDTGGLLYQPQTQGTGSVPSLYVLGHDSVGWVDWAGIGLFLSTLLGVTLHGGLRVVAARRQAHHQPPALKSVYMYTVYERFWHWLQTGVILGLIFTGLVIHKPDLFGVFSFRFVVEVHNILAVILLINAAMAAFYHFASGEIKQFLPQPRGFFNQAIIQARFYLGGIFRGEEHPFAKSPDRKLNPLQQLTYLAILNVLLPLQVITGILMWGAQRWPGVAEQVGGLPFLGPFHSLIAWLFATFVVMHVYLTTTGHTPIAGIQAMITGWDEVEASKRET